MNSKESILAAVKNAQPNRLPLPDITKFNTQGKGDSEKFIEVLQKIGGDVFKVNNILDVKQILLNSFADAKRIITNSPLFVDIAEIVEKQDAHSLQNTDIAILVAQLGVEENSAVWVTDKNIEVRVIPFICQQLILIISATNIVQNMHQAYDIIGNENYGYGVFIAGPSKTADIEQSLVLGAHGPKSMILFLLP
jgi:L-lactate dehydrogenase complex protein LldG